MFLQDCLSQFDCTELQAYILFKVVFMRKTDIEMLAKLLPYMPHGVLCRSPSYLLPRHTLLISTTAQFEILLAIINNKLLATRGLEPETTCRCPFSVVPSFLLVVLRVSDLCRPTSFNGIFLVKNSLIRMFLSERDSLHCGQ